MDELRDIQVKTDDWGRKNQVCFDPAKEDFKIVHPRHALGDPFKWLGTLVDCGLTMQPLVESILTKCRPKIRALLRLKDLYTVASLLNLYKTHIWSRCEFHSGALILALPKQLQRIDKMQRWFLHELGLSDTEAFVRFNFAPPSLRRSIGMLGFLHKRVLEACHPTLLEVFSLDAVHAARYHDRPLASQWSEVRGHSRLYNKSIYMHILMYNRIPQDLVEARTVSTFQSSLTKIAKHRAENDDASWRCAFQTCKEITDYFHS